MRISSSNYIPDATITIAADDSGQDSTNIKSFDFSTSYTGAGTDATMQLDIALDQPRTIDHVALAGHTLIGSVEVLLDDVSFGTYSFTDNRKNCIMFTFDALEVAVVKLVCDKQGASSTVMLVSHVAAGMSFNVPNSGETSGYLRLWLAPTNQQQVTLTSASTPVAFINKPKLPRATLNIPNMPTTVAIGDYRDLCEYMVTNAYFVIEREDMPNASYLCFDTIVKAPKAHSATRVLVNCSFSFHAYTGV